MQPEEGDDERRELERLVAEAQARRKERKHAKKGKAPASGASTPPIAAQAQGPSKVEEDLPGYENAGHGQAPPEKPKA